MNSLNFNIDNGYLEGLVRGFKAGILKHSDYANLVQCETLEGKYIMIISIPQSCKLGLSLGEVAIGQAISPIATHFCVAWSVVWLSSLVCHVQMYLWIQTAHQWSHVCYSRAKAVLSVRLFTKLFFFHFLIFYVCECILSASAQIILSADFFTACLTGSNRLTVIGGSLSNGGSCVLHYCRFEASSSEHRLWQLPCEWSKSARRDNDRWQAEREACHWVSAHEKPCPATSLNVSWLHHVRLAPYSMT